MRMCWAGFRIRFWRGMGDEITDFDMLMFMKKLIAIFFLITLFIPIKSHSALYLDYRKSIPEIRIHEIENTSIETVDMEEFVIAAPALLPAIGWFASWLGGYLLTKVIDRSVVGQMVDHVFFQIEKEKALINHYPESEKANIERILKDSEEIFRGIRQRLDDLEASNEELKLFLQNELNTRIILLDIRVKELEARMSLIEFRVEELERIVRVLEGKPIKVQPELTFNIGVANAYPLFLDSQFNYYKISDAASLDYTGLSITIGAHFNYLFRTHLELGYYSNYLANEEDRTFVAYMNSNDSVEVNFNCRGFLLKYWGSLYLPLYTDGYIFFGPEAGFGLRYSSMDLSLNQSSEKINSLLPYIRFGVRFMSEGFSVYYNTDFLIKKKDVLPETHSFGIGIHF